ncbi:hypothetical protein L1S32_05790 [Methanogenium sp. S4BF]|uniref:hypothetical protein n=1 Tax=Methanogenium sp. S4BF TaxID=1789226 RepID=UPI002417F9F6|nr:hypothetical protein [Methanogenium sp. S4BF]WFN35613.1 hypothetical protein L1S32_05790 [Methanogenium sp. S4BF]
MFGKCHRDLQKINPAQLKENDLVVVFFVRLTFVKTGILRNIQEAKTELGESYGLPPQDRVSGLICSGIGSMERIPRQVPILPV